MSKDIFVALIDSGCTFETHEKIAIKVENNKTFTTTQNEIKYKHGDIIGQIISFSENIKLYDIQVFDENLRTTPSHIIGALTYLLDKKVDVINMSLGLKTNYKEIEDLCKAYIIANGKESKILKNILNFISDINLDKLFLYTSKSNKDKKELK